MNQFNFASASGYQVQVDKATYKMLRRLETLNFSCKVEVYLDERGNIHSLRVIKSPEEILADS